MDRHEILKLLEEKDEKFAAELKKRDEKFATELKKRVAAEVEERVAAELKQRDEKYAAELKQRDEKYAAELKKRDDEIESLRNAIQDAGRNAVAAYRNVEYESMTKVVKREDGDVLDFQVERMNDLVDARSAAQDAQVENI